MLDQQRGDLLKCSGVFETAGVSGGSAYRTYNGIDDLFQDTATAWVDNFVNFHLPANLPARQKAS